MFLSFAQEPALRRQHSVGDDRASTPCDGMEIIFILVIMQVELLERWFAFQFSEMHSRACTMLRSVERSRY